MRSFILFICFCCALPFLVLSCLSKAMQFSSQSRWLRAGVCGTMYASNGTGTASLTQATGGTGNKDVIKKFPRPAHNNTWCSGSRTGEQALRIHNRFGPRFDDDPPPCGSTTYNHCGPLLSGPAMFSLPSLSAAPAHPESFYRGLFRTGISKELNVHIRVLFSRLWYVLFSLEITIADKHGRQGSMCSMRILVKIFFPAHIIFLKKDAKYPLSCTLSTS